MNSKSRTRAKIGPLNDGKGGLIQDNKEMSIILNKIFSTVFTKEDLSNIPVAKVRVKDGEGIEEVRIEKKDVTKAIEKLKRNKSAGGEGMDSSFIKEIGDSLAGPLMELFNKSLLEGKVPDDWKVADVTPVYKTGSKQDPGNYRPVSLTSHVGKLMERILKEKIVEFLEENKLLGESQHGFRKDKSCLTNLLEYSQIVADYIDNGEPVDIIFLDFQKAFDKVPHERLLEKMKAHGIRGRVLEWIREWLR